MRETAKEWAPWGQPPLEAGRAWCHPTLQYTGNRCFWCPMVPSSLVVWPLPPTVAFAEQINTTGLGGLLGSVVFVRNDTAVISEPALERVRARVGVWIQHGQCAMWVIAPERVVAGVCEPGRVPPAPAPLHARVSRKPSTTQTLPGTRTSDWSRWTSAPRPTPGAGCASSPPLLLGKEEGGGG